MKPARLNRRPTGVPRGFWLMAGWASIAGSINFVHSTLAAVRRWPAPEFLSGHSQTATLLIGVFGVGFSAFMTLILREDLRRGERRGLPARFRVARQFMQMTIVGGISCAFATCIGTLALRYGWRSDVADHVYRILGGGGGTALGGWWLWEAATFDLIADGHACGRCGYDLRATPDRCPECGTQLDGRAG